MSEQCFAYSTGIIWKDALAGFREIGVDEAVTILEESARRLGGDPSLDRKTRRKQTESYHPNFDDLDGKFNNLMDRINLYAIMVEYITRHRELFYYEGDIRKPEGLLNK